jgi:hypothetical protein
MASRHWLLVLAAAASLGLAACQRGADTGPTAGTNGPGQPGTTGNGGTGAMGGPGAGFAGGMNPQPGHPTGVAAGSPNRSTGNSVGNR